MKKKKTTANIMVSSRSENTEEAESGSGFLYRLTSGGFNRVVRGTDLHLSILTTLLVILIDYSTSIHPVNPSFVSTGEPLARSLIAFILAALAIVISFSDDKFLGILKELEIYNNILFSFEWTVYLTIITSAIGIFIQSYSAGLNDWGIYFIAFYVFTFFFIYMTLAVAKLVSLVVSIGDRKAQIANMR